MCQQWFEDKLVWMAIRVGDEYIHITTRGLSSSVWPTHHHLCTLHDGQRCFPHLLEINFLGFWYSNVIDCQFMWWEQQIWNYKFTHFVNPLIKFSCNVSNFLRILNFIWFMYISYPTKNILAKKWSSHIAMADQKKKEKKKRLLLHCFTLSRWGQKKTY